MHFRDIRRRIRHAWQLWQRRRRQLQTLGVQGELWAAKHLRKLGYYIIERQARNLYGEVDIIAVDHDTVVFVEVKTRRSTDAGHPAEAVTAEKQQRLTRVAMAYLKHNHLLDQRARFDVIAIIWPRDAKYPTDVQHFRHAFDAQ
jgi:putative endonuclease